MTPNQLRATYIKFFVDRGHVEIPSASLVPENDPTTLFTSSGMQPLVPYLLGQSHPSGKKLVDSQKSFRSQDIEEVGDNRHTTFFEMLGNWSLGEYFKKEQLAWFFEFLTKEIRLDPNRLFVTVFAGNPAVPRDIDSVGIWKSLFSSANIQAKDVEDAENKGMQGGRIFYYGEKKNWWSRSGVPSAMPAGEPGGPDSEIFYDFGAELQLHETSQFAHQDCHVNCDCGRFMEIGNSVFMQYQKQADGSFKELPQKNVDFGGGFERILAAMDNTLDVFTTDLFRPILTTIEEISHISYDGKHKRNFRIIADHVRASVMLAADGVVPSNKEQGYVLRRLIRRAVRFGKLLGIQIPFILEVAQSVIDQYKEIYSDVGENSAAILSTLQEEEQKFGKTITKGLKEIEKVPTLNGEIAFTLYETYGFPFELTEEIARERGQQVEYGTFRKAFEKHQELSRTTSKGMFKGGLADHSEIVTKYHTATHLLHAALREVLGKHVTQQGSNLTAERLRFDFSHPQPLTEDQKKKVESIINEKIADALPVTPQFMKKDEALAQGALAFFQEKYGDTVSVYTIGHDPEKDWYSKELCGGPHVKNTQDIGKMKITKEESIGSGKRRIYLQLA
ncbi:MAG: alanine--tRNA ligase [Candidatus Pacebacteria bacterium]|nr:alanine--tRNA ligase [Candidatus Paceibacterota bacterium]